MKRYTYILIFFTLVLVACGPGSNRFKIEGQFTNLSQGELYVYSPDGGIEGIDTIKIQDGRFSYTTDMTDTATLVLVFPNFSEQPVFAQPGGSAELKADASHLKEMEITGSKDNELMTSFRKRISHSSPPEMKKIAEETIKDNPKSMVAGYLINKYFVNTPEPPDYKKAIALIDLLLKVQHGNGRLVQEKQMLESMTHSMTNVKLPQFSAMTIDDKPVSDKNLSGKVGIINVWASWNYESMDIQRQIQSMRHQYGGRLAVVSISLDASKPSCKDALDRDSIKWANVCDERVWDSKLLNILGIGNIPDNILVNAKGYIVGRDLNAVDLRSKVDGLLK
jgi:hypothetical protein